MYLYMIIFVLHLILFTIDLTAFASFKSVMTYIIILIHTIYCTFTFVNCDIINVMSFCIIEIKYFGCDNCFFQCINYKPVIIILFIVFNDTFSYFI